MSLHPLRRRRGRQAWSRPSPRLLCGVLLGLLLLVPPAPGRAQAADDAVQVQLEGGDLAAVLNRYAEQAGVLLSYDAGLLQGQHSPGLSGHFGLQEGFDALLAGSGYRAVASGPGRYLLQPDAVPMAAEMAAATSAAPAGGVVTLEGVVVTGSAIEDGSKPNTGYTVRTTSSATKLDLAPKETPQSVTTFTAQQIQDQGLLTVTEVLDQTPGITLVSPGVAGAGSQPVYARTFPVTAIQMDGVMASSFILSGSGEGDIGMQDSFLYERIDVLRGSNSLTGGAGDASASLNFVRKHPYRDRHFSGSLKYGSWNTRRAELDYSTPINERLRVRAAGAVQKGDHWVDRVGSERKAVSLIGELDATDHDRLSLGLTHFSFDLDGAGPHGITRFSEVQDRIAGTPLRTEATAPTGRNFNNATPWSRTKRRYTNLFTTWEHVFDNDWLVKASYNYANNKDDKLYGEMGTRYYVPWADMASYTAQRENMENRVHALDVHLKGSVELGGREQELVVGASYYDVHRRVHGGYASEGGPAASDNIGYVGSSSYWNWCSESALEYLEDSIAWDLEHLDDLISWWEEDAEYWASDPSVEELYGPLPPRPSRENIGAQWDERQRDCERLRSNSGISIDEWEASGGNRPPTVWDREEYYADMFTSDITVHIKRRQKGLYFASHLRPLPRTHLILGGRWARDEWDDHTYTCSADADDDLVKYCDGTYERDGSIRRATPPRLKPKFLPYAGLIYELTPQLNAYASYTSGYTRDNNSGRTINLATGEWLPPVRSITYEGGLKGAFFNNRLNAAASYFKMEQKDFPYQTNDPNTSGTIDEGWRVYGWEFNLAGAITPNWNVSGGYVKQKQVVPRNLGEVLLVARDDFTGSYRAPEKTLKLFTSYRLRKLTLGAGLRWQGRTESAWIPIYKNPDEVRMMKQGSFYLIDLMARYQLNRNFSLQLNVNNVLDKQYYLHERSYISGAPRNALLTLNYKF